MSTDPLMTAIFEDLAAGRIDAAEAARRIDALKAAPREDRPEPQRRSREAARRRDADPRPTPPTEHADDTVVDPWAVEHRSAAARHPHHRELRRRHGARRRTGAAVASKPVNTNGVERITVRAVGRRVRIVGETSVATLSADGPHVLRRNGSMLEVSSDGEIGARLDGFSILRGVRATWRTSARSASARSCCSGSTPRSRSTSR